jgi:hypothetical protein
VGWGETDYKPGVEWGDMGREWGGMGWNARGGGGGRSARWPESRVIRLNRVISAGEASDCIDGRGDTGCKAGWAAGLYDPAGGVECDANDK